MNVNQIINLAVRFELEALKTHSTEENPHYFSLIQMENGKALWEAVNVIVESYVEHRKQYEELEQFTDRVCKGYDNLKCTIKQQAEEIADLKQQLFDGKDNPLDDLPF